MSKKLIASLMIATLLVSNTLYAQTPAAKDSTTSVVETNTQKQDTKQIAEIKGTLLTLDEAIAYGLENSLSLKQVHNQADIAKLVGSNGEDVRNTLNENTMALSHAGYLINDGRDTFYEKQTEYNNAKAYLEAGLSPITKTIEIDKPEYGLKVSVNVKAGTKIVEDVTAQLKNMGIPEALATGVAKGVEEKVFAIAKSTLEE